METCGSTAYILENLIRAPGIFDRIEWCAGFNKINFNWNKCKVLPLGPKGTYAGAGNSAQLQVMWKAWGARVVRKRGAGQQCDLTAKNINTTLACTKSVASRMREELRTCQTDYTVVLGLFWASHVRGQTLAGSEGKDQCGEGTSGKVRWETGGGSGSASPSESV